MNCRFRRYFATLVILFSLLYFAPVTAAQQEQPSPQSPSVQERQTPPPEAVTPERTVAETGPISWGSLVFGLIIGGIAGYLLGMGRRHTDVDIHRDRAA